MMLMLTFKGIKKTKSMTPQKGRMDPCRFSNVPTMTPTLMEHSIACYGQHDEISHNPEEERRIDKLSFLYHHIHMHVSQQSGFFGVHL